MAAKISFEEAEVRIAARGIGFGSGQHTVELWGLGGLESNLSLTDN